MGWALSPTLKDPSDDMLLELAVAANAQHIVTYNLADFKGVKKFNIDAINPKHYLELIGEF
jgi:predicted nucleic acid-binding protein